MDLNLTPLQEALKNGLCRLSALPPSAQALLGRELLLQNPRPQLWVVDHLQALETLTDCFKTLCPQTELLLLPPLDAKDMETQSERLKTLAFLQNKKRTAEPFCLLTVFQCLEEKVPTLGKPLLLKRGDTVNPEELFQTLEKQGYTLDVELYEKGFAARRGGIIDVWPPTSALPVRIEFFGDEIDSLRTFETDTQRSVEKIEQIEIYPLNAQGDTALAELLPENTLRICSGVEAECDIQIGCVTSDVIDLDLGFYETNLKPVSELHRPEAAEQQRKLFFQGWEKMGSNHW
ncbi:MAG: hypothetical protein PHP93_05235, partial [Kiritimatiellales bacterium]|nr:hypothetical protein [Kiritimatiellales bacterium]